jgi:hypothetical protein
VRKTGRALRLALVLGVLAPPLGAQAQSARARVGDGEVSGVEMALEGGLSAPRGGTLRWHVTAYEVLGLSELRPAPDATVHVATSLDRSGDAAAVTTDGHGRAQVAIPIPEDAPDAFRAVLRLVSRDDVQRRFELTIRATPREAVEVHLARARVRPGGPLRAFGRVAARRSQRPLAGRAVRLTLRDAQGRPLDAPAEVRTDAAGLFAHTFALPDDAAGAVTVEARTGDDAHPVRASAQSTVAEPAPEPLLVAVGPARALLAPGQRVAVDVAVRSPEGRPIEGATVTLDGARRDDPARRAVTDARGRARLSWRAPGYARGIRDATIGVTASKEGWGTARGTAPVRIAADRWGAALAVEGGALAPSLGGHVWVRVVGADGRPAGAGVPVRAEGPRLPRGGVRATTGDDGVATLDVRLPRDADATADRCGGETATAFDVRVGDGADATTARVCLPLDPDAAARVRVARPLSTVGEPLELSVDRVRAAAGLPVAVTVLATGDAGPAAVAAVTLAPDASRASIDLPPDASGPLWIRARPLVGDAREVVRGGVASAWVVPGAPARVAAELAPDGTARLAFEGAGGERSAYVVAAPIDEARRLAAVLRRRLLGPLGDLRADPGAGAEALIRAALAAHTRPDVAAPAVLRGGRTVPVPAPADATASGLLRDPWRARARFVTGRLALVFHALEGFVAEALPERIDDVAVRGPRGGWDFNAQILESVAASGRLGAAGATGLGGDPLTIDQLRAFDPSLTYDRVAQRITRERLFRLILALRGFVQGRGFDLPWSRLGDPSEWMRQLRGQHAPGVGTIRRAHLVDGWGRPFRLQRARGGRSRFTFVDPLGAWEIVSAGPDGRFGTRDDQWDPTARVLRSGTPYAEAVGEDVLVARLEGVELGRASVELLHRVAPRAGVGGVPGQRRAPARQRAQALWNRLPERFEPPPEPLALRRPAHPGDGAGGTLARLPAGGGTVALALDAEPRTWGAVVWAWTDAGWGAVDVASALAGAPLIVEAPVPARLRAGEPVELDAVVTNVSEAPLPLRLRASGTRIAVDGPDALRVGAGEAERVTLRLAPEPAPGEGRVEARFVGPGDEAVRTLRWPVEVATGDHPLRLRAAGLVRGRPWRLRFGVPADARRAAGRVVLLAPSALWADPDLADARRDDPALVAFAEALAGRTPDPALWAALLRAQRADGLVEGRDARLSSACAAVAWASAGEHDEDARAALARLRAALGRLGRVAGRAPDAEAVRSGAAVLAALSAGGVPPLSRASERRRDPVVRLAAELRVALRRTLRVHPEEPTLLARAAGALLLADPRDAYGRAMLERAAAHLEATPDEGARVVPSERRRGALESLGATFALAVAAHQARRPALAARLLRGALARDHVAQRAGGPTLFWMLAAGAYGALGRDPAQLVVHVDGERRAIALDAGRAVVPLAPTAGAHRVRVEPAGEGSAFVRVEAAMERPFVAREQGPLRLALEGDPGDVRSVAALELTVRATEAVEGAVVDLQLPAGVEAGEALREALRSAAGVTGVEVREPGFLRVRLAPMDDGTARTLPLPLRWTVRGRLRGLGAVAYPLGRPGAMTSLAPRPLEIRAPALTR